MKKICSLVVILLFSVFSVYSQYTIKGSVKDANTKKAIEFCSIVIKDSTKFIAAIQSDINGNYTYTSPTKNNLFITFTSIGYKSITKKIYLEASIEVPDVLLKSDDKVLNQVEVTTEKSYVQNTMDKRIINIDKNSVSTGGTAVDILQTLPGVSLNSDEKVEMRGSANLNIQIDGKPVGSRGGNLNTVLEQIPASSIESIEIIGNPSAKYDAEGSGGIINIVLKKNKQVGISGNLTATVGTRNKYTAGGSLNYKNKFMNIATNLGFQHNYAYTRGVFNSSNFNGDSTFYQHYKSSGLNKPLNISPKVSVDFFLNDKNTLSLVSNYSINRNNEFSRTDRYFLNSDSIIDYTSNRQATSITRNRYVDGTLSYRKLFKQPKQEFTIDIYYQNGKEYNTVTAPENYINNRMVSSQTISDSIITDVKLQNANVLINYVHPINKNTFMEMGYSYKYNMTDRDLNYLQQNDWINNEFYTDSNRTNQFAFEENIHAGYITYNSVYGKLSYKLGLRAENTSNFGELKQTNQTFRNNYFQFFPSIHMNVDLGKDRSFRFTYSRRLQRPNMNQLNPFGDYSDPRNVRSGNPALKPETTHSFEFGFDKSNKKFTFSSTLYYRLQTNMITFIRKVDADGFGRITSGNVGTAHNYGVELSGRYNPYKWWNISLDINGGGQTLVDSRFVDLKNRQNLSYGANLISNWTILKFWNIQAMYNYRGPSLFPQGRMRSMHGGELGMKFFVLKGKLIFNLRFSDVFNTRQFAVNASGFNFESSAVRKRDTRNFYVGITYRFGSSDKDKTNNRRRSIEENNSNGGGMEVF
ncbi:MAG: TonB-dependent receptor [Bacteroidota bacterium]